MNKKLAFALPLALGSPLVANAATTIDGTSGSTSKTGITTSTLSNLRSGASVDIQVSSGVILKVEDGTASNVGASDIAVTSCHEGGSAAYFGDTGGGSIQKDADFGTGKCTSSNLGYDTVSSG
ncbi:hypothetical protein [Thiohalorhabdus methylotrophus]|uniref:Uncharacterized protein n=1 Tax=Thiohalorhabdus methylotrophus TaxID=3242694 RepID=A0ABV4TPZ8_9GAMM